MLRDEIKKRLKIKVQLHNMYTDGSFKTNKHLNIYYSFYWRRNCTFSSLLQHMKVERLLIQLLDVVDRCFIDQIFPGWADKKNGTQHSDLFIGQVEGIHLLGNEENLIQELAHGSLFDHWSRGSQYRQLNTEEWTTSELLQLYTYLLPNSHSFTKM